MRRLRSRLGQTSAEYLGIVALVVAIAIALFTLGRPLAVAIGQGLADAACRLSGGENCGGGGGGGGGVAPGSVPPWALGVGGAGGGGLGGAGSVGGPHGANPTGTQADPVNSLSGAWEAQVMDARLAGPGLPFTLARSYSSANAAERGPLGPGWTHTYAARLEIGQGSVVLHSGDGQQVPFAIQDSSLVGPPWAFSELRRAGGGYELLTHSQVRYRFDGEGRLLQISDRNRNRVSLSYDERGYLAEIADPAGRRISLGSDPEGRLTEVALPDGRDLDYAYDSEGRLERVTDLAGGETTYAYDSDDRVTEVTDQLGVTLVKNSYGDGGRVTRQEDARGGETSFDWDAEEEVQTMTDARGGKWRDDYEDGTLVGRTDPLGNSIELSWDQAFDLTAATDPRGYRWKLSYDEDHNLTRVETPAPLSYSETVSYNGRNDPVSYVDPAGVRWSASYDARGNLVTLRTPDGAESSTAYDGRGLPVRMSDPLGRAISLAYDRAGNLVSASDPLGATSRFDYDEAGRMIAATDPRAGSGDEGFTWRFSANARDQISEASDPLGNTSRFEYDPTGRLTEATDAQGRSASWSYNDMGDLVAVTAPGGASTTYAYDRTGDLVAVRDPLGNFTRYVYDQAGQTLGVLGPSGELASFEYDEAGNLISTTDPNGNATEAGGDGTARITYDALSRPTAIDFSDDDTADLSASYDSRSLLTELHDGQGVERYSYDSLGRPTSVRRGSEAYGYRYDLAGQLTSRTYPDGSAHSYAYDAAGRLARTSGPEGTTAYRYDAAGNRVRTAYPNGIVQTIRYDPAARVTDLLSRLGSETIARSAYTLDATGNPTLVETEQGPTSYRYDERDRLVETCYAESCDTEDAERESFSYDALGNITTAVSGGEETSYSYDASSRISELNGPDGELSYAHDENGNLTQAGDRSYAYDQLNQLVAVRQGAEQTDYAYDGNGLRVAAEGPGGSERMSWDKSFPLPQLATESGPEGESSYSYGRGRISQQGPRATLFFQADALGSTRALTTPKGKVASRAEYRPYGAERSGEPELPSKLRFTGELRDDATGLYYLRARDYDPASGRFLQPDPLSPGLGSPARSPYAYAEGRPTARTDPSGMSVSVFGQDITPGFVDEATGFAGDRAEDVGGFVYDNPAVLPGPVGLGLTAFKHRDQIAAAADDVYNFVAPAADEIALGAGLVGLAVCTGATGGGCAALAGVAIGGGLVSTAHGSGVVGPGEADWGEFGEGLAWSAGGYGVGKGFQALRNFHSPTQLPGGRSLPALSGTPLGSRVAGQIPRLGQPGYAGYYAGLAQPDAASQIIGYLLGSEPAEAAPLGSNAGK
jgi:RHS repeat-associated protein